MVKFIVPHRFSKNFIDEQTIKRFCSYLGALQNFFGGRTVEHLTIRIFIKNNEKSFRIINEYNNKYNYKVNEYIKSFFRTYSDGIFTNVIFLKSY